MINMSNSMVCITGKNGTERKFLFFLFLGLFQPIFAWNEAITVSFNLLNFFVIFFEFSLMRRVGMKQQDNFYFLSLSLFQPVLAWNAAEIVFFFNFLKNFAIFLEFSITHRDGTEPNDNFYFLYFSAFSNLFWLEMKPQWYCLIFWFFCYFYGIFYYASDRNETER